MMNFANSQIISCIPRLPNEFQDISYDSNTFTIDTIKKYEIKFDKKNPKSSSSKLLNQQRESEEYDLLQNYIDYDEQHDNLKYHKDSNLNRYSDMLPYDYNRIHLSTHTYINASPICLPHQNAFIATQGPIKKTIKDFYQMVDDYNVKLILMLCKSKENERQKCEEYWEAENIKVSTNSEKITNTNLVRRYMHKDGKEIIQINYKGWPDHGIPNIMEAYNDFIYMINTCTDYIKNYPNSPIIVHCSAGVGRTGTFITLYNLCQDIMKQRNNPDFIYFNIFNIVRKLKELRGYLVENINQYFFIYDFINILLSNNL